MEHIETSAAQLENRNPAKHNLTVVMVDVKAIRLFPGNARQGNLDSIQKSIEATGMYQPLIVQLSTGHILIGNNRYRVLRNRLKATHVPVIYIDCDEQEALKINLNDNKSSDDASWNNEALLELLDAVEGDGLLWTDDERNDLALSLDPLPLEEEGKAGVEKVTDCPNCGHIFRPEMREEF